MISRLASSRGCSGDEYSATSPYLLPDAEPMPYEIGEHIVASSSKLIAIDKILADILPKGERVLIFSVSQALRCHLPIPPADIYFLFEFSNGQSMLMA